MRIVLARRRTAALSALPVASLLAVCCSLLLKEQLTDAEASAAGGELAVFGLKTGNPPVPELLLVSSDGQPLRTLAGGSAPSSLAPCAAGIRSDPPSWSPDGHWVAFAARVPTRPTPTPKGASGCDIYILASDGSGLRRLTYTSSAVKPVWSPAGDRIAFSLVRRYPVTIEEHGRRERGAYADTARLWSIRPDGSGAQPLEPEPRRPATLVNPERALKELKRQVAKEGKSKALRRLVERSLLGHRQDYAGGFTPDGSQLVFTRHGVEPAIMAMPARGGHARLLVTDGSEPALSPDGRLLAFDSARDHNGQICASEDFCRAATELYLANSDGADQRRLTHTRSIDELAPTFSPDGTAIAYVRGEGVGAAECTGIWELPASGDSPRPLLADPGCETWYYDPAWGP